MHTPYGIIKVIIRYLFLWQQKKNNVIILLTKTNLYMCIMDGVYKYYGFIILITHQLKVYLPPVDDILNVL